MQLEAAVGQLLMVGFDGLEAPPYILDWLARGWVGGVYLFARNIESPSQVKALTDSCHNAAAQPILIGIDQEGGAVSRLGDGFTQSPGAMALAASGSVDLARQVARVQGVEMAALGINWNFAPVADVADNHINPSVGTRSFGADAGLVADFAAAQVAGFQSAGVAATVKHFPGLGKSIIDTHLAPSRITHQLDDLRVADLLPFRRAMDADVACVMTTHVRFDALDDRRPATLSPRIITGLLRGEMAYAGVVCSDCMEMRAITDEYGAGEAAVLCALAGADLIMFSHTRAMQEAAFDALLAAAKSGRLSRQRIDESLRRIRQLKARYRLNDAADLDVVGCEAHLALARQAARAGIVLLRRGANYPLRAGKQRICCVEFRADAPEFTRQLKTRNGDAVCLSLPIDGVETASLATIEEQTTNADCLIVATRNAHLSRGQADCARRLLESHDNTLHVCLRHPADAAVLPAAATVICATGDSAPSLEAAAAAICGEFAPGGNLTVSLDLSP